MNTRHAILAAAIALTGASVAHAEAPAPITHGREISGKNVGPRAASYVATQKAPEGSSGEIKAGQVPPYARLVETAATYDGFEVPGPHLLIENIRLDFPLDIYAPMPVVLRGVYVQMMGPGPSRHWGIHTRPGSGPLYVLWSQVAGAMFSHAPPIELDTGLLLRGGQAVIYRSHIWIAGDGIHADSGNTRIVETLIDGLISRDGSHNDAIQTAPQAHDVVVERSRIENQNQQTSCIYNEASNVTIRDNYLSGGGWVIYGGAKSNGHGGEGARNVEVTGNDFGRKHFKKSGHFGPVAYWDQSFKWSNNWFEDGTPVKP